MKIVMHIPSSSACGERIRDNIICNRMCCVHDKVLHDYESIIILQYIII